MTGRLDDRSRDALRDHTPEVKATLAQMQYLDETQAMQATGLTAEQLRQATLPCGDTLLDVRGEPTTIDHRYRVGSAFGAEFIYPAGNVAELVRLRKAHQQRQPRP